MSNSRTSYQAAFQTSDQKAIGCVYKSKKDAQPDILVKIGCHYGDLRPYFEIKLTVTAPASMHLPNNKYSTFSKLYTHSLKNYKHDLVTQDNIEEVLKKICKTHRFDKTALAYYEEKLGVVKLTITYKTGDSTYKGLFNTLSFKRYIDPKTDKPLKDKPYVQHAFNNL